MRKNRSDSRRRKVFFIFFSGKTFFFFRRNGNIHENVGSSRVLMRSTSKFNETPSRFRNVSTLAIQLIQLILSSIIPSFVTSRIHRIIRYQTPQTKKTFHLRKKWRLVDFKSSEIRRELDPVIKHFLQKKAKLLSFSTGFLSYVECGSSKTPDSSLESQ